MVPRKENWILMLSTVSSKSDAFSDCFLAEFLPRETLHNNQ